MRRARGFPPSIPGMESLLWLIIHLRDNGTRNDECHDAVGVGMGWRACSYRITHFNEKNLALRFTGEVLPDHHAPRLIKIALADTPVALEEFRGGSRARRRRVSECRAEKQCLSAIHVHLLKAL